MTMPDEVYDEMLERCNQVTVFIKGRDQRENETASMGAIIRCADDGFMTVECGQQPDDSGFVTIRRFDRFGEQIKVDVIELDGSVMVTG